MDLFDLKTFVSDHTLSVDLANNWDDKNFWKKTAERMFSDRSNLFPNMDRKLLRKQDNTADELDWMGMKVHRGIWAIRHPVTFFGNSLIKNCGFLRYIEFIRDSDRVSLLSFPLEDPQPVDVTYTASSLEFAALVRFLLRSDAQCQS